MNLYDAKSEILNGCDEILSGAIIEFISKANDHSSDVIHFTLPQLRAIRKIVNYISWLKSDLNDDKRKIVENAVKIICEKERPSVEIPEIVWLKSPAEFESWFKSKNKGVFEEKELVSYNDLSDFDEFMRYFIIRVFLGAKYEREDVKYLYQWVRLSSGCSFSWWFKEGIVLCENPIKMELDEDLGAIIGHFKDGTTLLMEDPI